MRHWLLEHLLDHYGLYGDYIGVRTARKHIGWALQGVQGGGDFLHTLNTIECCEQQHTHLSHWLQAYAQQHTHWPTLAEAAAWAARERAQRVGSANDEHIQLSA